MAEIAIFEVGPRDGLQNEEMFIDTDIKIELINRLSETGLKKIEVTSFVSPKWVPQMSDAREVMAAINRADNVTYAALTPNQTGMEAAIEAKADEVAIFAAASESFSQKNINCSIEESLHRFEPVLKIAGDRNIPVRGYVSCATHCPYEGKISPEKTAQLSSELLEMGCYEISLGDTIGKATPDDIKELLGEIFQDRSADIFALHCHDTFGRALSNITAGLEMGIRTFDSSVAGLGGCPYAKGASGNVATEAVVQLLHERGHETGIDLDKIRNVAQFISEIVRHKN